MTKSKNNVTRPYSRTEIDLVFKARKQLMHNKALIQGEHYDGNRLALYIDCYTGKILRGGERYDYEHIISAEEIFMHYRTTYSNKQIAEIVNHPDNVSVTLRTINQYKGKYDLQSRILDCPEIISRFKIDKRVAVKNFEKAKRAVWKI